MSEIILTAVQVQRERVNTSGLHETLAARFANERFLGISTGNGRVIFHFKDEATEADKEVILQAIDEHDPDKLTAEQAEQQARVNAYARFISVDFEALRGKNDFDSVLDALKDIQLLMRGAMHG